MHEDYSRARAASQLQDNSHASVILMGNHVNFKEATVASTSTARPDSRHVAIPLAPLALTKSWASFVTRNYRML